MERLAMGLGRAASTYFLEKLVMLRLTVVVAFIQFFTGVVETLLSRLR